MDKQESFYYFDELQYIRNQRITENESSLETSPSAYANGLNECYANRPSVPALYRPAPFNDDPEAVETRAKCDYSIKITKEMAYSGTAPRPVRVYADGIYDLCHRGHARLLMQAKNAFPSVYLIAGVQRDLITHQNKGKTVMTEEERYECVRHCRYVDEVVKDPTWFPDDKFMTENKIDFVAHDDIPYTMGSQTDGFEPVKAKGMFVVTERTEGISTTDLVARIVKDYDMYARRNLKRGYAGKEMNLTFFNETKYVLQNKMDEMREQFQVKSCEWYEKSREFINSFVELFGKDGRINTIWKENKQRLRQAFSHASTSSETSSGNPMNKEQFSPPAKTCRMNGHQMHTE